MFRFVCCAVAVLVLAGSGVSHAAEELCIVGKRVLAEPGDHPATVLGVSASSCRLHYEDRAYPDGWDFKFNLKDVHQDANNAALAAKGPRLGRYTITIGGGSFAGYLMISAGGRYEVLLPGGKSGGAGRYLFDAKAGRMRWLDGPLADPGWDGTQKLEGDSGMLKIRIGKQAVATNTGK
ncbi:MAG: hypothetical protein JO256_12640 [Alphaproteobacteria bacterium]|nr:hypothetical protein [Alphaproteobacteria bacterium]